MSDNPAFERFALADPLGLGVGFLVPVFRRGLSNSLFTQRIEEGRIRGFEPLDLGETRLIACAPLEVTPDVPEFWAFAFAQDDIVLGQGPVGQDLLSARLDDPLFAARPGLGFEVAEFLDRPAERLAFARSARDELAAVSRNAASRWCDLSVLTPDLRRRLKAGREDAMVAGADRLVATVEHKTVTVHGASMDIDGDRQSIVSEIEALMQELVSLYGRPARGWEVEFRPVRVTSKERAPELVAMSGSRDLDYLLQDLGRDGVLNVDVFDHAHPADFLAAQARLKRPGFLFFAPLDPTGPSVLARRGDQSSIAIELQPQLTTASAQRSLDLKEGSAPVVVVQTRASFRKRGAISPELRPLQLAMTGLATVVEAEGKQRIPRHSYLLHGRGQGPDPSSDAWLNLYDRAWALELDPHQALCIAPTFELRAGNSLETGPLVDALLPVRRRYESELSNRVFAASRADAMLLVPASEQGEEAFERRRQGLIRLLDYQGWSVEQTGRADSELIISGGRGRYFVSTRKGLPNNPDASFVHRRELRFDEIERFLVSSTATPGNVLSRLALSSELELNARDLLQFPADRSTIYTILGAQLGRMMTGFRSRTRSDFLSLLIADAMRRGDVDIDGSGAIEEAVANGPVARTASVELRRVRRENEATLADVVILATDRNEFAPARTALIEPFTIIVHHEGVVLQRRE